MDVSTDSSLAVESIATRGGDTNEGIGRPHLRIVSSDHAGNRDDGWDAFATFVIEFQRRSDDRGIFHRSVAHHMESGRSATWDGVVALALVRWILSELGAIGSRAPEASNLKHPGD